MSEEQNNIPDKVEPMEFVAITERFLRLIHNKCVQNHNDPAINMPISHSFAQLIEDICKAYTEQACEIITVLQGELSAEKTVNGNKDAIINGLQQQLSEAKAEMERLKEYTNHKPSCLRYAGSTLEDCTCGLEQALKS